MAETKTQIGIEVTENGPYHVTGGVKLVRIDKVTNEKNEHIGWHVYEEIETEDEYLLCRCGQSETKPFCSDMHLQIGFDGTETAQTNTYAERAEVLGGYEGDCARRPWDLRPRGLLLQPHNQRLESGEEVR